MRVAIVTSEVNFVKDNYSHLLGTLLSEKRHLIKALVVIKTLSPGLLLKTMGLYAMGCPRIATILLKNSILSLSKRWFREFRAQGIPIHRTQTINRPETIDFLRTLDLDLLVNVRTRDIYKKEALTLPRIGAVNIHHGILPKYRGTMCDLWALADGRDVGYTIHWMNQKIDAGDIITVGVTSGIKSKDFSQVPYLSSKNEARDLVEILDRLERREPLPRIPNRCPDPVFSRNPTASQITQLKRRGVRL